MTPSEQSVVQGALALAGMVGADVLQRGAVKQYHQKGMEETGPAFENPGFQQIINQYTQQTGLNPEVTQNFHPAGVSARIGNNLISLNVDKASKFTLGHELGHQFIEDSNGPLQWIQRHTYQGINPKALELATIGVSAAIPSVRRATSFALGMNYLNNSGRIISEIEASRRGTQLLNQAGYPVSPLPGTLQATGYVISPAVAALGGLGAGRFLRSFVQELGQN